MSGDRNTSPWPGRPDGKPPTLKDVARLAGVSPITVSRTLNQPEIVRPALREKVFRAVRESGYQPAMLTTGSAPQESRLIAILVPTIVNSIFADTVQALMQTLTEAGHQTLLGLTDYSTEREERLLEALLRRRPDAVVLTGTLHTEASRVRLVQAGIPLVECWDQGERPLDMLVGFSHVAVGQAVARALLARGYRHFASLTLDDPRGRLRRDALRDELAIHGLAAPADVSLPPPATPALGRQGLARLLEAGPRPEVVVCSSDTLAHGALAEAQARGLRVPQDLSVMGFGNLASAAHLIPALSTVDVRGAEMGTQAAEALLARLAGAETRLRRDTGFELVMRESTR
ncbi:LacI family DNA-binding transcriptional regulator [uncultured Pseudomonas sp.]|uniref:LacI family DNA-binding transcriptional regulator n=1 Tax=uncultured Pseudomonas sp. TaxID=114707 RepID=UPI002582D153|nr:LacI family DNA-binding transcriptional regulator [uncultured Pseudomonas sp.]